MSATEIHDAFVNNKAVESMYRFATHELRAMSERERLRLFVQARRAVKARDPKVMTVLDKGAEILAAMAEDQYGRTNRTSQDVWRAPPTEFQIWREAYRLADEGTAFADNDQSNFIEVYTSVCLFAGVISR